MNFNPKNKRHIGTLASSLALLLYVPTSHASLKLLEPADPEQWIKPQSPISFQIDDDSDISGILAIFVGKTDVTPLFHESGPGIYTYSGTPIPLPSGESELVLYDHKGEEWRKIGSVPLKVLTSSGFESVEYSPRIDITVDSQHDEGHSGDAEEPERKRFSDTSLQAGFSGSQSRNSLSIESSANLSGASREEQALQFAEKGEDAPKVDLADYLIEAKNGNATFAVGHITYGQHPLLVNSISNRGVMAGYRFSERFDFSIASQNGTSIVGFSNPVGLAHANEHNIASATVGYEMIPSRPGALRVEVGYVTAQIQPEADFDVGEVPDAEKSDGWGLRLIGSSPSGRLRGEVNFARASYTNPEDPFITEDLDVVPVKETTNEARAATLSYDLVRHALEDERELTVTATLTHERTDPLYKTLTAFPNSDTLRNGVSLSFQLGETTLAIQHAEQEDNLDNIPSILKTRTRSTMATASWPLSSLSREADSPSPYWPVLSLNAARVHQYAGNKPATEISDFNDGSHLPDQMNTEGSIGLEWSVDRWDFGYTVNASKQDNRQKGREDADFSNLGHEIAATLRATDTLEVGISLGRVRSTDEAESVSNFTNNVGMNLNWIIAEKWTLSGNVSRTLDDDSEDLARNENTSNDVQLARTFSIPFPGGRKRDGQFFIRYNQQENDNRDNLFEINSFSKNWAVTSGLSFSLF